MVTAYVLKYSDGSLAGIDYSAGGYPYKAYDPNRHGPVALNGVKFFNKVTDIPYSLIRDFPELTIATFQFEVK